MYALHISSFVFIAYALVSLVLPIKIRWPLRLLLGAAVAFCGLKYLIYSYTGGILEPQMRPGSIVIHEALYAALMIGVLLAIAKDIVLLFRWIAVSLQYIKGGPLRHGRISLVIAIISLSVGFLGTLSQFNVPQVKEETVYISGLPAELEGYQIVQLTDLHIGPVLRKDFLSGVVDRTNSLDPDLVVITGDLVDGAVGRLKDEFTPFAGLRARHGVLAVTGNHEYYSGANSWVKTWEKLGIKFLNNESVLLRAGNVNLRVAGVPDPRGVQTGAEQPDIEKAYANIIEYTTGSSTAIDAPTARPLEISRQVETIDANSNGQLTVEDKAEDKNSGAISFINISNSAGTAHDSPSDDRDHFISNRAHATVLLAHQPRIAQKEDLNADLVLTGHTHGGTMFFLKPLIARYNAGYVSGMYKLDSRTHLYVSNGTGIWSGFSCRILVPAEITRFTLKRAL